MSELLKPIKEYFNTFNHKDYTIYVDGKPTEWCCLHVDITPTEWDRLNNNFHRIVWDIPSDRNERAWYWVDVRDIERIMRTPTTMELIRKTGKVYKLVAKLKTKETKAKDIILRAKNALYAHNLSHAMGYLDELNTLMDE